LKGWGTDVFLLFITCAVFFVYLWHSAGCWIWKTYLPFFFEMLLAFSFSFFFFVDSHIFLLGDDGQPRWGAVVSLVVYIRCNGRGGWIGVTRSISQSPHTLWGKLSVNCGVLIASEDQRRARGRLLKGQIAVESERIWRRWQLWWGGVWTKTLVVKHGTWYI